MVEPNGFIMNCVKYSDVKLTTIQIWTEAFMLVPKFQIVPSEIGHDINYFLCRKLEHLRKLFDSLEYKKREFSGTSPQLNYVERFYSI